MPPTQPPPLLAARAVGPLAAPRSGAGLSGAERPGVAGAQRRPPCGDAVPVAPGAQRTERHRPCEAGSVGCSRSEQQRSRGAGAQHPGAARAEAYLGEKVTDAVITVPAYFNDAERQ
ncbi:Hsp70 family protein, partial [Streptomyces althioticus]